MAKDHALSWPGKAQPAPKYGDSQTLALIQRCLQGDEAGYGRLYQQFSAMIYRLCYGMLQNRQDAEEVMQDAFEYAFRRLDRYDPNKAAFKTWLYQIAISRCRNKRRRKWLPTLPLNQMLREEIVDENATAPAEWVAQDERQARVWAAIQELSPKLRETAVLRYYEGLAYAEIGQILAIPAKTAESRMRLAHKALRDLLSDVEF